MTGKKSIRSKVKLHWGVYLVLAAALTGGMYGRLVGFGERQLAVGWERYEELSLVGRIGSTSCSPGSPTFPFLVP